MIANKRLFQILSLFHIVSETLTDFEYRFDKCPHIQPVNLDQNKYNGIWYNVDRAQETSDTCPIYNYTNDGANKLKLTNDVIVKATNMSKQLRYHITLRYSSNPAGTVLDLKEFDSGHNYYILGTDYSSYAVEFTCQVYDPDPPILYVWIQSRMKQLTAESNAKIQKILAKNGLAEVRLNTAYDVNKCRNY